ncbi:TrmB family transcriptional regulator [Candidatus Pacearchaeota archaeon]|nr:TrmB family transcriptional regulator [Candidatus Pacearchaeota archaeon]
MIIKPELVKKVKSYFDLNIYETKVWLALLSKGISSAGEIAELSGVPRSRTYDVLESLEKQGFALAKIGKPVKYIAVKPEVVIEKLKSNIVKNADEKVKMLGEMKRTKEFTELEELHKTGFSPIKQSEMSGTLRGKLNVYSHIREMLENAEKEVIICMSAQELENKSRIFTGLFEKLKKAGINVKIALSGSEDEVKKISNKLKIKAEKIDINAKFFIADRKQIMFIVNNLGEEEELGIWLNSEFFSNSLAYLFDNAVRK